MAYSGQANLKLISLVKETGLHICKCAGKPCKVVIQFSLNFMSYLTPATCCTVISTYPANFKVVTDQPSSCVQTGHIFF